MTRGLLSLCIGTVECSIDDDLLHPVAANGFNALALLLGCVRGKVDGASHLELCARVGQALRVVTCGCADNTSATFFFAQGTHSEIGTAHLKRTALLHILALEVDGYANKVTESL